jgi:hypothetical protein
VTTHLGIPLFMWGQQQAFVQSRTKHFQGLLYHQQGVSEKEIGNSIK